MILKESGNIGAKKYGNGPVNWSVSCLLRLKNVFVIGKNIENYIKKYADIS